MNRYLSAKFLTLGDLYLAYRKAKVDAFYENTHFHALAFAEYETHLNRNLERLRKFLLKEPTNWASDLSFLGDYAYLPKSVKCTSWDKAEEGHFRAIDPIKDWNDRYKKAGSRAEAKLRLVIRPTVNFQIISALWLIKVGHIFDGALDKNISFGNRLRKSKPTADPVTGRTSTINLHTPGLFEPYFPAYREWRERGLNRIEESLIENKNILAITMDIEQFYHRISPRFLLRDSFLNAIRVKLSDEERAFTAILLDAISSWYNSTPDYDERPTGAVPVGLSASKVIANVLLATFDRSVIKRIKPIYYGRYVDDIFLVFENKQDLSGANEVSEYLSRQLGMRKIDSKTPGETASLRLVLPFARDSKLVFTGPKQKIFALTSSHGIDLIQNIREQIRIQSSEYRLLPSIPLTSIEMASKALLITPDASLQADALRKADVISVRRLGFSLLLRNLETYSADLTPATWLEIRSEFYGLVKRHVLTPSGFFDYFGFLPRVFSLMLACSDYDAALDFVKDSEKILEIIRKTTTAGERRFRQKFNLCRNQYANALVQSGLQAASSATAKLGPKYLNAIKSIRIIDTGVTVPRSLSMLAKVSHEILLTDFGRRPYKDYWYLTQKQDERGPLVPESLEIRKKLRLGWIRRFRKLHTRLKTPHWPALAFPTRPLRFDEIALVAPDVLPDAELYKEAIFVLRGARVRSESDFGIRYANDSSPASPLIQFVVPGDSKEKIRIAVTSVATTDSQWHAAAKDRRDRSATRYKNLNDLINRILKEPERPKYIVLPELSIPLRWALRISRKLAQNNVSLIAGIEYYRDKPTGLLRNDCLISLATRWPGYVVNVTRLQPKFSPAHDEKALLRKHAAGKNKLYEPTGIEQDPTLYIHNEFCFSVLICSDLTNIQHRHNLRGEIDALFVVEWNKDTKTFSSLVESTASDLHAYIIQVNNRLYGDSRIRVPADKDYLRDVVQVKGGAADYHVVGELDVASLRDEQRKALTKEPQFKPLPIGYRMSNRRK